VNVKHSHEAAAMAVTLIRSGDAEALMKGSLHTDELMAEVISRSAPACAPSAASATSS
jgi:phosphate acetyltransferase